MAQDVVVNGTTYPAVESVVLMDANGSVIPFYPDAVRYNAQTLTEAQKAQARKNIGAQAELTDADKESIVQQVITALGTPVFGTVDADNNIILTGELADGTYTIKYEDADGNQTTIGTLTAAGAPSYTNVLPLAIGSDGQPYNGGQGWKTGTRLNSSGAEKAADGFKVTGFIPVKLGDIVYLNDVGFGSGSDNTLAYVWAYDSSFAPLRYALAASLHNYSDYILDNNENVTQFTVGSGFFGNGAGDISSAAYVRLNSENISADSIITVNQPIE